MSPARGAVVLVPFPFTDLSAAKRRPALVVSPEGFHPTDVVLCAITSQVPERLSAQEVDLAPGDLEDGQLPKPSVVRVGKLFTMHRELIIGEVGRLKEAKLADVLAALRKLFSA